MAFISAKTQKAKGIMALANWSSVRFSNEFVKKVGVFPYSPRHSFPFFARPCPMIPRHGFVDSRLISNQEEWTALIAEVEKSGESVVEIVMMPFIPCTWSGIATPHGLTFGTGHDGATSGKGAKQVPAASASAKEFLKAFSLEPAALESKVTDTPFIEFVEFDSKVEAVQLRNGPAVALSDTYIPKDMTVQIVVKVAGEDLMEWEKKMKELVAEQQAGVVIWHPQGAMSSHYSVQAIEQSKSLTHPFAVLIQDDEPVLGASLKVTANVAKPMSESDLIELAKMVAFAITNVSVDVNDSVDSIHLAIAALHAQALWGPDRHLLVLRAASLACMMRFASAAILGELRHWGGGPGKNGVDRKTQLFEIGVGTNLNRKQVYEKAFSQHIKHIAPRMETAYQDFKQKGWSSSYGGKKWAECTEMTAGLFSATSKFLIAPTSEGWQDIMTAWNHTVNVFHNTGQLLNKFIPASSMDIIARVPSWGMISDLVGALVVDAEDFGIHRDYAKVGAMVAVTLPKIKKSKPKPIELPSSIDARWNMLSENIIYVQMKFPFTVNKEYGMALQYTVGKGLGKLLSACKPDGTSLTGSSTLKGKGVVENLNGIMILKTTADDYWVPLCTFDSMQGQVKQNHKSNEDDE